MSNMEVIRSGPELDMETVEIHFRNLIQDVRLFMEYLKDNDLDSFEALIDDIKITLHRDPVYATKEM